MQETGRLSPRWQIARVALAGAGPWLHRISSNLATLAFGAYAWSVLLLLAAWVFPCVLIAPKRAWRHRALNAGVRLFFRLTGILVNVQSEAPLPEANAIIVANHSSYLDGMVITAVCPGEISFVAKEELARQIVAGTFLRRLGAIFVRRSDPAGGVADARAIFANAGTAGVSCGRLPDRRSTWPARRSGHDTWNSFDVARWLMAAATGRDFSSHRSANSASRRRLPSGACVTRLGPRRNPRPLRRTGPQP